METKRDCSTCIHKGLNEIDEPCCNCFWHNYFPNYALEETIYVQMTLDEIIEQEKQNFENAKFSGSDYVPENDQKRLTGQIEEIYKVLLNTKDFDTHCWWTLEELGNETGYLHTSISAQLRNLRKESFGSHIIEKRHRGDLKIGLWEYRMVL